MATWISGKFLVRVCASNLLLINIFLDIVARIESRYVSKAKHVLLVCQFVRFVAGKSALALNRSWHLYRSPHIRSKTGNSHLLSNKVDSHSAESIKYISFTNDYSLTPKNNKLLITCAYHSVTKKYQTLYSTRFISRRKKNIFVWQISSCELVMNLRLILTA